MGALTSVGRKQTLERALSLRVFERHVFQARGDYILLQAIKTHLRKPRRDHENNEKKLTVHNNGAYLRHVYVTKHACDCCDNAPVYEVAACYTVATNSRSS
jgi:hypothetical protein